MEQVSELLGALQKIKMPTLWLWANIDPGSDDINRAIRMHREYVDATWLQVVKNFNPDDFQMLLANSKIAIGNSSSFVRDASILGIPVVLIGDRQKGRETGGSDRNSTDGALVLCIRRNKAVLSRNRRDKDEIVPRNVIYYH